MKVAIYARYSSDNQRDASIADQLRICREFAARQGWTVTQEFTDQAIEMVMEGVTPSVVKDELNANAARREQLEAQLAAIEEPPPLLHPEMARIYREKVSGLAKALHEPDSRSEATEALRGSWTPSCSRQTTQAGRFRSS
jgi:hypothetical protein